MMVSLSPQWARRGALSLTLLAATTSGFAQQAAPATPPRWYVGVQAVADHHIYSLDRMGYGAATRSAELHGGYALSSRLGLQLGVRYGRSRRPNEERQGSAPYSYYPQTEQITRAWAVPVQLRWALAPTPHRFQVEGLIGGTVSFFRLRETGTNTATDTKFELERNGVNGYLDLGVDGRLRLNSQFELTTDLLVNLNAQHPNNIYLPLAPGFGAALGLNYRFR